MQNNDSDIRTDAKGSGNTTTQFSIENLAKELGVPVEEAQQAVETVGSDPARVREYIIRNHTEADNTNDLENGLKSSDCWTSEA